MCRVSEFESSLLLQLIHDDQASKSEVSTLPPFSSAETQALKLLDMASRKVVNP